MKTLKSAALHSVRGVLAFFGLSVLFAIPICAGGPPATYRKPADLQYLTQNAQIILVGRCTDIKSTWNAEQTLISTYTSYDVVEAIKGASSDQQVVVKTLGGTVGSITQMMVGGPTFEVGERALLFLAASDELATFRIQGLRQGKLRIYSDSKTGERFLMRDASRLVHGAERRGVPLQGGSLIAPSKAVQSPPSVPRREPLAQVLQEIQRYLQKTPEK